MIKQGTIPTKFCISNNASSKNCRIRVGTRDMQDKAAKCHFRQVELIRNVLSKARHI